MVLLSLLLLLPTGSSAVLLLRNSLLHASHDNPELKSLAATALKQAEAARQTIKQLEEAAISEKEASAKLDMWSVCCMMLSPSVAGVELLKKDARWNPRG